MTVICNPLDSMTWKERFAFAFHALVVLEGKYEEALAELQYYQVGMLSKVKRETRPADEIAGDISDKRQIHEMRGKGMSYKAISKLLLVDSRQVWSVETGVQQRVWR